MPSKVSQTSHFLHIRNCTEHRYSTSNAYMASMNLRIVQVTQAKYCLLTFLGRSLPGRGGYNPHMTPCPSLSHVLSFLVLHAPQAAMDALMVDKGDPWNPSPAAVEQTHRMCSEISRVLVSGGVYVQLSFEQAHFRRKLLLGEHLNSKHRSVGTEVSLSVSDERLRQDNSGSDVEGNAGASTEQCVGAAESGGRLLYGWDVEVREIQREGGCFGNFLYIMRKRGVLL